MVILDLYYYKVYVPNTSSKRQKLAEANIMSVCYETLYMTSFLLVYRPYQRSKCVVSVSSVFEGIN